MARNIKYTKELLLEAVNNSKYWTQVCEYLGIIAGGGNYRNIQKKVKEYKIDTSHFLTKGEAVALSRGPNVLTAKDLLVKDCKHSRAGAKRLIYKDQLLPIKCVECGQKEVWRGKKMSLILDHINGISNDNRIENLRLLCPNCNATLDTHCSGNRNK